MEGDREEEGGGCIELMAVLLNWLVDVGREIIVVNYRCLSSSLKLVGKCC